MLFLISVLLVWCASVLCFNGLHKSNRVYISLRGAHITLQSADVILRGAHITLQSADLILRGAHITLPSADVILRDAHITFAYNVPT